MEVEAIQIYDVKRLEEKLEKQHVPLQRLAIIDKLATFYIYTDVSRAIELLEEQEDILKEHNFPDFILNYHFFKAVIANQRYNFDEAERHFQKAIRLLEEMGTVKQQVEAFIDYAGTCINLEKMQEATSLLEKAAHNLKKFPDEQLMAWLTCRNGFLYLHYGNYPKAIELFLEADKKINSLGHSLQLKDYYFLTLINSGLGRIYEKNDEPKKSIAAYKKVIRFCETYRMKHRLSWHYLNMGRAYMALAKPKEAEFYFEKVIPASDDKSQLARASAYANMGYCYFEKDEFDKALKLFDRAEEIYKDNSEQDYYNFSVIALWRGKLYGQLEKPEQALEHYFTAYNYARKIDDHKQLSSVCREIANIYAEEKNYQKAYEFELMQDSFKDTYFEQINLRKQAELEAQYEAEKKKQEAELHKLKATKLQLKALRAQMNPHFMYNALNSIQHYITSNEVSSAARYLAKFARLMRQSLEYSDLEIISLEKEIEFLDDYLGINQKLRFQDQLDYEILVDDDIEEDILGVPTMIVQPYVENAIEHGLRTKKDGKLSLKFSLYNEDTILCIVEDNGVGIKEALRRQRKEGEYKNHRSRGTAITEERLRILHNSKAQGVFVSTKELKAKGVVKGTRVEILIPIVEVQVK